MRSESSTSLLLLLLLLLLVVLVDYLYLLQRIMNRTGHLEPQTLDPVVHVGVNELVLALRLDHVVALLAQSAHHAEDGKFGQLGERVSRPLQVIVHREHYLLQIVDGRQGTCAPDSR